MSTAAPPVKQLGDAAARRDDDAERAFCSFTPAKRKASLYEDVTMDTQLSLRRHVERGWPLSFDGVHGVWSDDSTLLDVKDWHDFRDPNQWWERVYYQQGSQWERQIDQAVSQAAHDGLFADFDPAWVEFLRANLMVPAFAQHGLWLATAAAGRDTLSDTLTHAVVMQAAIKQRFAQSLVLYGLDLEQHFGEFSMPIARERWLTHPAWQATRAYVEELRTVVDWGEGIVAINLCFEPILGVLIQRELGTRAAAANGDTVTPVIGHVAQAEWRWVSDWTIAFCELVCSDEEHGGRNRELIREWAARWLPKAIEAASALEGIISELPVAIDYAGSRERTLSDARAFWERAGITELLPELS